MRRAVTAVERTEGTTGRYGLGGELRDCTIAIGSGVCGVVAGADIKRGGVMDAATLRKRIAQILLDDIEEARFRARR
jgi:hypothetical protein